CCFEVPKTEADQPFSPSACQPPKEGKTQLRKRRSSLISPRMIPRMNVLTVLPMAFVMVAGPQILSAIFLATSEDWRRNSAAFVAGAALSVSLFVGIAYVVGRGINSLGGDDPLDIVVLVLLVAAAIHAFLTRKTAEPPKWMGKLQNATPKVS